MEMDKRQQSVIRLLQKPAEPGECTLNVIQQTANYAGLTKAIRHASQEPFNGKNHALVLRGDCAHKKSTWHALLNCARAHGIKDNGGGYESFIGGLLKKFAQPLCLVLDHAGMVRPQNLATAFRAADEAAYRAELGVRLVLVITRESIFNYHKQVAEYRLPDNIPYLHERQITLDYGFKSFSFVKPAAKVQLVESLPLLEQEEEEHAFKIAV